MICLCSRLKIYFFKPTENIICLVLSLQYLVNQKIRRRRSVVCIGEPSQKQNISYIHTVIITYKVYYSSSLHSTNFAYICPQACRTHTDTNLCCLSSYPLRIPYYYYILYRRSNIASSLAQQLHSLNVDVSNRMALNSRENQAEILHLNIVSWYLHLKT